MRKGGDRRGSAKTRRARKHWMLEHFDPELGPDMVRCRLVLSDRCFGILDYHLVTAERIDNTGPYTRDNIVPACAPCQNRQGGLGNVRTMADLLVEYLYAREQWEYQFESETGYTYRPGIIAREARKARGARGKRRGVQPPQIGGGRNEVTDFVAENPPPMFKEWLVEWHAARRGPDEVAS